MMRVVPPYEIRHDLPSGFVHDGGWPGFLRGLRRLSLPVIVAWCLVGILARVGSAQDLENAGGSITNRGVLSLTGAASGLPDSVNGTFRFIGGDQHIPAVQYSALHLAGSGIKSAGIGRLRVTDDLRIDSMVTLQIPTGMTLSLLGSLEEAGYLRGIVQRSVLFSSGLSSSRFGEIGMALAWRGVSPGLTTVTRVSGVASRGGDNTSIKRYYDINSPVSSGFEADLVFQYDPDELNGHSASTLGLWNSLDGGVTWRRQGGVVDTTAHTVRVVGATSFGRWTAADIDHPLGPTTPAGSAFKLVIIQKPPATSSPASTLDPFIVAVQDAYGSPVRGVKVSFRIASKPSGTAGDSLVLVQDSTTLLGRASATLRLGNRAGDYVIEASVSGLVGSPATSTVRSIGVDPASGGRLVVAETPGTPHTGTVYSLVSTPIGVTVTDLIGNPAQGVVVTFSVTSRPEESVGDSLTRTLVTTDSTGRASVGIRLGTRSGQYRVRAELPEHDENPLDMVISAAAGPAARLTIESGAGQVALIDRFVSPLKVRVQDEFGNPVPGASVTFAVHSRPEGARGDSLSASSMVTDTLGRAEVRYRLGSAEGEYALTAVSEQIPGSSVMFSLLAVSNAGPPAVLAGSFGGSQRGQVMTRLPQPFRIVVQDADGRPVEGVAVAYSIAGAPRGASGFSLSDTIVTTNAAGEALTTLHLGTLAGTYTVTASSPTLLASPIFSATAVAGPAATIVRMSEDYQVAEVRHTLPAPLVALVSDRYGNPVPGHDVQFTVRSYPSGSLGFSIEPAITRTDEHGQARAVLTLGSRFGVYRTEAMAVGLEAVPATFWSTATIGGASTLMLASGDQQRLSILTQLPNDLVVQVADPDGNPVSNVPVQFAFGAVPPGAAGHSLSASLATTDQEGKASVRLHIGDKVGQYRVVAAAEGLAGSPITFREEALHGEPRTIAWDRERVGTGVVGGRTDSSWSVRIRDVGGNPVPGVSVEFSIIGMPSFTVGQELSIERAQTDSSGRLGTVLTFGNRPGQYTISASSAGLSGSPLSASAYASSGVPAHITLSSGSGQIGGILEEVRDPLVVLVTDIFGNPLEGVYVTYTAETVPEGATIPVIGSTSAETDQQGFARSTFTTGDLPGTYGVRARARGVDSTVLFVIESTQSGIKLVDIEGDGQSAIVGSPLNNDFRARVVDAAGRGVQGVPLIFHVEDVPPGATGYSLSDTLMLTDTEGYGGVRFTLGSIGGRYRVSVRSDGVAGSPWVYDAYGLNSSPAALRMLDGSGQTGYPGQLLPVPLSVLVTDSAGMPIRDIVVTFRFDRVPPGASGYRLSSERVLTDSSGLVSASVTLGSEPGEYRIRILSPSLPEDTLIFSILAAERVLPTIRIYGGTDQRGPIGTILPENLVVQATDSLGHPIEGVPVSFRIIQTPPGAQGQTVSVREALTDHAGEAATVLTLGNKIGTYVVAVSSSGAQGGTLYLEASASVGPARSLARVSGNGLRSAILTLLPNPLTVAVRDEGENAVPGVPIMFSIRSIPDHAVGAVLSVDSTVTDSAGQARVSLRLGNRIGQYVIEAHSALAELGAVSFTSVATTGGAAVIVPVGDTSFSAPLDSQLDSSLVVSVSDAGGNPLSDVRISFQISETPEGASGQSLSVKDALTDQEGRASTVLRMGRRRGVYAIDAIAASTQGSPVRFRIVATVGAPVTIVRSSDSTSTGPVSGFIRHPLRVRVTDIDGNGVQGLPIAYSFIHTVPDAQGQSIASPIAFTDSNGIATTVVRLGDKPGTYAVQAGFGRALMTTFDLDAIAIHDPNDDYATNIGDMTTLIDHITGTRMLPPDRLAGADLDSNGTITIEDVYALRDGLLSGKWDFTSEFGPPDTTTVTPLTDTMLRSVHIDGEEGRNADILPEVEVTPLGLRFNLRNTIPVKAMQFYIRLNGAVETEVPDILFDRITHMTLASSHTAQEIRLVLFDLQNRPIRPDTGTLFRIPIRLSSVAQVDSVRILVSIDSNVVPLTSAAVMDAPPEKYPVAFGLEQNYPNPFNAQSVIRYDIKDVPGRLVLVSLDIFDLLGRRVRTLIRGRISAGRYAVVWDGTGDNGDRVASGVYFYRLIARDFIASKKLLLLK